MEADPLESFTITDARKELSHIFGEVNYSKKRIIISNQKKRVAIVPIEDLEALQALEDAEDLKEAEKTLKEVEEEGSISFEEMRKRVN